MKVQKLFHYSYWIFWLIAASAVVAALALQALIPKHNALAGHEQVEPLPTVVYQVQGKEPSEGQLPLKLNDLKPKEPFTLTAYIEPGRYDCILVKTIYTRLKLYADEELIYECGQKGTFPSWLIDPPTLLKIVKLPQGASVLRFEYEAPSQRSTITLPKVMCGSADALELWVMARNCALFVFSALLLFLGASLVLLNVLLRRRRETKPVGQQFLYIGLFAWATGGWGIAECNATAFIFPFPTFLYLVSLGSLFALVMPILAYGLVALRPANPVPVQLAIVVMMFGWIGAVALQFAGISALYHSLSFFQILDIIGIAVYAATVVREHTQNQNPAAKRMALPCMILVTATSLELVNYNLHMTDMTSLFVHCGVLLLIFLLCFSGIWNLQAALAQAEAAKDVERRLKEENAALDRLQRLRSRYMAAISHDMKSPLTVISVHIQQAAALLGQDGFEDLARASLARAQEEIMKIANTMENVLEVSSKSEISWDMQEIDFEELLGSCARSGQTLLRESGNTLSLAVQAGLPPILGNRDLISQVLNNLIANANRHTHEGEVRLEAKLDGQSVIVTLKDNGEGMPPQLLARAFERGVSGDGGTGMGLSICREIMRAHGGDIGLASEEGCGATATLCFPLQADLPARKEA